MIFVHFKTEPRTEVKIKTAILAYKAKKTSNLQIAGTAEKGFCNGMMF